MQDNIDWTFSENDNNCLDLVFEQKQIDMQKQSLHYSYETLLHLLSAAENFAGLSNEQYGAYNISIATEREELKSEFAWEIECFKLSMKSYKENYGEYNFPTDLPKEKLLFDINRYIKKVQKENDKILYYAMANLILGKNINIDFDKLFEELEKNSEKNFDPRKLRNLIGPINNILNNIEKNADGQFQIRKYRSKTLDKLINESKKNANTYLNDIIGKKGYLKQLKMNSFIFENDSIECYRSISLNCQNSLKRYCLYKCLIDNKYKGYFFLLSDIYLQNKGFYSILFDEGPQPILEKYFNLIYNINNIHIYQIDNSKEKKYALIIKNEIQDFK